MDCNDQQEANIKYENYDSIYNRLIKLFYKNPQNENSFKYKTYS